MLNRFYIKRIIKQPKLIIIALSSLKPIRKFLFLLHSKNIHTSDTFDSETILEYNKHRKYGPKDSICLAANNNLYFDIYGNVLLCCYNRKYTLGNIKKNSLDEIWNSSERKIAVSIFKNYNMADGCSVCHHNIENKYFQNSMSYEFDVFTNINGNYPSRIDFEMSNTCNLECIMCNGEFSNLIRKNRENRLPIKNPYNEYFLMQLKPYLKNLQFANFLGGEPQLIKIYYKIWKELIELKKSIIRVQSNGTVLNKEFKELLKSNQFQIALSIDVINDKNIFKKIRLNGNYEDYLSNISYFLDLYKKGIIDLTVSVCPMIINITEILPIIKFCNLNKINFSFNYVINPFYLSLKNAPTIKLIKLKDELESYFSFSKTKATKKNRVTLRNFINLVTIYIDLSRKQEVVYKENMPKSINELKSQLIEHLKLNFKHFSNTLKLNERMMELINKNIIVYDEPLQKIILIQSTFNSTVESNNEFTEDDIKLYLSVLKENIDGIAHDYMKISTK